VPLVGGELVDAGAAAVEGEGGQHRLARLDGGHGAPAVAAERLEERGGEAAGGDGDGTGQRGAVVGQEVPQQRHGVIAVGGGDLRPGGGADGAGADGCEAGGVPKI